MFDGGYPSALWLHTDLYQSYVAVHSLHQPCSDAILQNAGYFSGIGMVVVVPGNICMVWNPNKGMGWFALMRSHYVITALVDVSVVVYRFICLRYITVRCRVSFFLRKDDLTTLKVGVYGFLTHIFSYFAVRFVENTKPNTISDFKVTLSALYYFFNSKPK